MARRRSNSRERTAGARQAAGVDFDDTAFQRALRKRLDGIMLDKRSDLMRLGLLVQNNGRRFCPVDTGRLRASVQAVPGEDARGPFVDVGTNVEYGPYVEYGTEHSPAQPFMRPALLAAADQWRALAGG